MKGAFRLEVGFIIHVGLVLPRSITSSEDYGGMVGYCFPGIQCSQGA